jgi:SAM-dependent methyltransferase
MATLPYKLPFNMPAAEVAAVRSKVEALASAAQYGWGHTIDFGPFVQPGLLAEEYLGIADLLDERSWWPKSLAGMTVADVGCYTGGLLLYMAGRRPAKIYGVDELPTHLDQARFLVDLYKIPNVTFIEDSVYRLNDKIPEQSVDIILLSGVLYHLSDMLLGLYLMRRLLKKGGTLIIESNGVNDMRQSYANFGRFKSGMWWQPSGLSIIDMCQFMGFEDVDLFFYKKNRCLARATRASLDEIPFKRGINWEFDDLTDASRRQFGLSGMAPVAPRRPPKHLAAQARMYARKRRA